MACCAASLISAGAGKSGKPWERLTAPWRSAKRVISRITDSVKRPALEERAGLVAAARWIGAGFMLCPVEPAIDSRVSRDDLHVQARLRKWNRLHEFRGLAVVLASGPRRHAVFPGIVRGYRFFDSSELFMQIGEVSRPQPDIVSRVEEARFRISKAGLACQTAGG